MYITSTPPPGQSWRGRGERGTPGLQAEEPADADPTAYEVWGLHDLLRGRSRLLSGVHVDLDMRDQVATRDARDDGPNPRGGRQQTLGRHRTNPIARFSPGGGAFGWLICRQESCVVPSGRPPQA